MSKETCYITDIQGNFYTINRRNELAVARCKKDAFVFLKAEAERRIGKGKKSHFYRIIELNGKKEDEVNKQLTIIDDNYHVESEIEWLVNNWKTIGVLLINAQSRMNDYQTELYNEQSRVDKEISDIYHFIELYEGSDKKMLDATFLLKDKLKKRREVKEKIAKLLIIKETILADNFYEQVENANNRMGKMDDKRYNPRVLRFLF